VDGIRWIRARLMKRLALMLLLTMGVTGCYRVAELQTTPPPADTRIVASISPAGSEELAEIIGANAVGVEGRVISVVDDQWELSVMRVDHERAPSITWNGERVLFPAGVLRNVRERQHDPLRTGIFMAGIVGTSVALAVSFIRHQFQDRGDDGGGGQPAQ
jgi:hypothetical protein